MRDSGLSEELQKAKNMVCQRGFSLAVHKKGQGICVKEQGIAPVMAVLAMAERPLEGASACDKVVGKAAALLLAYGGIAELYACVVSQPALEVLEAQRIPCVYNRLVPRIQNRDKNGLCPMEEKAMTLHTPEEAWNAFEPMFRERELPKPLSYGKADAISCDAFCDACLPNSETSRGEDAPAV